MKSIPIEIELRTDQVEKLEEIYNHYGIPPNDIISMAIEMFIAKQFAVHGNPGRPAYSDPVHLETQREGNG